MKSFERLISFYFFALIALSSFAQKEANIWYFGNKAGLDFNNGSPRILINGQLNTHMGSGTISDSMGNMLFYTDGITIWDKNHNIMPNGDGLLGDFVSSQSGLIVPHPGNSNLYYVFSLNSWGLNNGLRYSVVDMSLNNGNGDVTNEKNILLYTPSTEKITAVKHSNGNDIWVITHNSNTNEFVSYLVTDLGLNITPYIQAIGGLSPDNGCIKVSSDGKRLATSSTGINLLEIYDYDTTIGQLSNLISINNNADRWDKVFGIEFSPNGRFLYTSSFGSNGGVFQYDLTYTNSIDIENSKIRLTSNDPIISGDTYGQLQIGPDGKIYNAQWRSSMAVIHNPDLKGEACGYEFGAIYFDFGNTGASSVLGLPQFIQSFFMIGNIQFENTCFGDATKFELNGTVDSVIWDFGDQVSGADNTSTDIEPIHVFTNPGDYEVSVTATVGTATETETTTVTIYEQPMATKPHDILLCDLLGDISFDFVGHATFILNGLDSNIFGVNYYEGMANYNNGIKIDQPEAYTNTSSFFTQEIIAEIYNKQNPECTDVTEFNVGIYKTPQLESSVNLSNLTKCDDSNSGSNTDGFIEFDLTEQEQYLLLNGVASEVHYNYFTDVAMSQPIVSPNAFVNTENPQTIYVEGVSNVNSQCKTETSFIIEVLELPNVAPVVELKQCDEDLDGFFSAFNLNEVINEITPNAVSETVTFHESETDAENNNNPITNSTVYSNQIPSSDMVWARVENNNGCFRTSQVNLLVTTTQIPNTFIREFYACDDDTDGVSQFDFSNVEGDVEGMFPLGQDLVINYYRNEADALAEENKIADISNYTNTGYPNTQQVYVRVDSKIDNDCLGLGAHINLYVEPQPVANPVTIERQCDDNQDEMFPFDTSLIEASLLNGQPIADVTVTYFDEDNNPLPSPLPNPFLTGSQIISVIITNNNVIDGSCYDETTLEFIVDKQPIANSVVDQISCDDGVDDADGFHEFDTSSIENIILDSQTDMEVHYYDSSGIELSSPLPNPFNSDTQTITVEVVNPLNTTCTDITEIDFIVNPLPEFSIETPQIVCSSDPTFTVVLDPEESNITEGYDYEWVYEDGTLLSNASTLTVSTPGAYSITLTKTDGTGCTRTRHIFVNASELATITLDDITIVDVSNNNTVTINTNNLGQGDYEYALDDELSNYQDEPSFSNVSSGIHTIYVRDKKGCGISAIDISVIGFPKYFTPNGDGTHDYWQIDGVNNQFQANSNIYIYDRYGKLLKQVSPNSKGWDGTLNGEMLTNDDYWFSVLLEDGRIFKGHFTLKR